MDIPPGFVEARKAVVKVHSTSAVAVLVGSLAGFFGTVRDSVDLLSLRSLEPGCMHA